MHLPFLSYKPFFHSNTVPKTKVTRLGSSRRLVRICLGCMEINFNTVDRKCELATKNTIFLLYTPGWCINIGSENVEIIGWAIIPVQ